MKGHIIMPNKLKLIQLEVGREAYTDVFFPRFPQLF